MAANVMQECWPGSAWQLGGLGGRLRLEAFSLSIAFLRSMVLLSTCGGSSVPLRPARPRITFFRNRSAVPLSATHELCVRVVFLFVFPARPLRVPLRECSEGCVSLAWCLDVSLCSNAMYCKRTRTILVAWRRTLCRSVGPAAHGN